MTPADEARRIVDAMKTCQTNHPEKWLEPIAAVLAAAERRGIERARDVAVAMKRESDCEWAMSHRCCATGMQSRIANELTALLALLPAESAAKCAHEMTSGGNFRHCRKCGGT